MLKVVPNNEVNADAPEVLVQLENPTKGLTLERLAQLNTRQSMVEIDADTCNQLGFDLGACQHKQIKINGVIETVPVVGPLRIYLHNTFCDCSALMTGRSFALGLSAIQML